MSLLVAIAFAVVCVAGVIDGDDVFDVAAVDGATNDAVRRVRARARC